MPWSSWRRYRPAGLSVAAILVGLPLLGRAQDSLVAPTILFTDIETGPTNGGPNNLGVPIAIFGAGFGATRGSSTVTIGGVEVGGVPGLGHEERPEPHA